MSVTDEIPPAFGQRLETIVHSMEAIDDGHRYRLAHLRKHWDTHMHHDDIFALDVVQERYLRPRTENQGPPEFPELLELYKDRVYHANITNAANSPPASASAAPSCETTATGTAAAAAKISKRRVWGGMRVLDLPTTSLTASTYNYEGKIRRFAEFCIDEEGIFPPIDCTESTCVRYLAWIAKRGSIGAGSRQPYLSVSNTFLRHTGWDDAPATGPAIGDMKSALQIRQL
eukprot:jgi/Tetstr1/460788/TSEL_005972.t1